MKTKLSININKPALIRNSRGANYPDLIKIATDCERYGADGITIHPRPDERHVRYDDVLKLKGSVQTEYNIEGYPSEKWIAAVIDAKPHQATLVPDKPEALTSDSGWDTVEHKEFLEDVLKELSSNGIRTSLFMGTEEKMIEGAKSIGADRIEFYTGPYALDYEKNPEAAIAPFRSAAEFANRIDIGINAGHDLNLDNLRHFSENIPNLLEVSIGHALWIDAWYLGLENTIRMYKHKLVYAPSSNEVSETSGSSI